MLSTYDVIPKQPNLLIRRPRNSIKELLQFHFVFVFSIPSSPQIDFHLSEKNASVHQ